jgi:hypothetical protein
MVIRFEVHRRIRGYLAVVTGKKKALLEFAGEMPDAHPNLRGLNMNWLILSSSLCPITIYLQTTTSLMFSTNYANHVIHIGAV